MLAYLVRRLLLAALTIWAISVLAFVIIELPPGDQLERYIDIFYSDNGFSPDPEHVDLLRRYLGLDKPQYVRYTMWMWNLMHGDLGLSFQLRHNIDMPVKELIGDRLWLTAVLTAFTILVTWTFAVPVGIYSAVRQHSVGDYAFTLVGFAGLAVPDFLLGLVLMYVAFAYFDQSVGGLFSADYANAPWSAARVRDLLAHLWVPAIVLGTSGTASLIRIMRNNLLDELGKPYVVTAHAKGASPVEAHREIPRPSGDQPPHQHRRLPAAVARQRQRDRLRSPEPPHARSATAPGNRDRGRVPGRVHHPDGRRSHRGGNPPVRHPPRGRRPTHPADRSLGVRSQAEVPWVSSAGRAGFKPAPMSAGAAATRQLGISPGGAT